MKKSILLSITLFNLMLCRAQSTPLGTAFTYQGRLIDNGSPANGAYDLRFTLHSASTGTNNQVGGTIQIASVIVTNGLFKEELDLGASPFDGEDRWLEIGVRPGGGTNSFTVLDPRQRLSPSPYALFAPNAAIATTANGVATSTISATQLNTPGLPATGQVLAYGGTGLVWTNASAAAVAWTLNGNSGTTPGVNFLGTSENQPLEIKVNGTRAFRLEPNANGAPNVIGGSANNLVDAGVVGATIAGGGATFNGDSNYTNRLSSDFSTIGGGAGNTIQADAHFSTISGGKDNTIQTNAILSSIGGGGLNTIHTNLEYSTISGGGGNTIQAGAANSSIGGGLLNTIQTNATASTIIGGAHNTIQAGAFDATISGGSDNIVGSGGASVAGGHRNKASGTCSFAAGCFAQAVHDGAFVWADFSAFDFPSAATNEFAVRATGGIRFVSGVDSNGVSVVGVALPAGSGSWSSLSDRNAKTNFAPVNSRELLDRLAQLPIQNWNYKSQSESVRHIGPTAQDFHAAFAVGEDDRHITTVDEAGVALAAIQGLNEIVKEKDTEIQALKKSVAELKELFSAYAPERTRAARSTTFGKAESRNAGDKR